MANPRLRQTAIAMIEGIASAGIGEPGGTLDADRAEHHVDQAVVRVQQEPPDHRDGHDAGDDRAGSSRPGKTVRNRVMPRLSAFAIRRPRARVSGTPTMTK